MLTYWLNANRICLNVSKTEVFLFESAKKQLDLDLKLKDTIRAYFCHRHTLLQTTTLSKLFYVF